MRSDIKGEAVLEVPESSGKFSNWKCETSQGQVLANPLLWDCNI